MNKDARLKVLSKLTEFGTDDWQKYLTPSVIASEMVGLITHEPDMKYIVMFDLAFVETLRFEYNIDAKNIVLVADRELEARMAKQMYGVESVVFTQHELGANLRGDKHEPAYFDKSLIEGLEAIMPKTDKLVIFGNPPYQSDGKKAKNIFHLFIEACISMNPRYLSMIVPSRWMHTGNGTGFNEFHDRMIADKRIKIVFHEPESKKIFPDNEIKGGVSYFLWDKNHNGECILNGNKYSLDKYDVVVYDTKAYEILDKIDFGNCLDKKVTSQAPFKIITSFKDWKESGFKCHYAKKIDKKLYKKEVGYVKEDDFVDKMEILKKWKVCVSEGGSPKPDKNGEYSHFNFTFIASPDEVFSQSYIALGSFDTKEEADNFNSYAKTKIFRYLLHLRATTQHKAPATFAFVPDLQDYSHPWDDASVCAKLGITVEEFAYINSKIRDWKEDDTEEVIEETDEEE